MKSTVKALILAGMLLGAAATADAQIRRRFRRAPRVAPRRRITKPYCRYRRPYVAPRVARALATPTTTIVAQPAPPADSTAVTNLKAEIAKLKDEYYRLFRIRTHLKNWLSGTGKSKSATDRAKVQARHDAVDAQCRATVAQYAALQAQLAKL